MTVGEIFAGIRDINKELCGLKVTGVTSDSREVREG